MARIHTYSRPEALANLDGRTREARLMRKVRADLIEHVGGNASATQRVLIDRAARLSLQLAMLDAKQGGLTEHDGNQYLAWTNTLTRLMRQLGLQSAARRPASLREHIASRQSAA